MSVRKLSFTDDKIDLNRPFHFSPQTVIMAFLPKTVS